MTLNPRQRKSWPKVLEGQDCLRQEVSLRGGREQQKESGIQARRYSLGSAMLMFWPSFVFFRNTVFSFSFSLLFSFTALYLASIFLFASVILCQKHIPFYIQLYLCSQHLPPSKRLSNSNKQKH